MEVLWLCTQPEKVEPLVSSTNNRNSHLFSSSMSPISFLESKRIDTVVWEVGHLCQVAEANHVSPQHYLTEFRQKFPRMTIVGLFEKGQIDSLLGSMGELAEYYMTYPLKVAEVHFQLSKIAKAKQSKAELEYFRGEFWQDDSQSLVKTENIKMQEVFQKVRDVAPTRSTVLLTGETGVGKSLIAQLIHQHSSRREQQFIRVHCGAISETLIESELFGHEKGAFTGAIKKKLGRFELAHGGTIFLDEVSTLTLPAQIKLLQVLQEGFFQRVGGEKDIQVDIRVIAATNDSLKEMSEGGLFRKDLFYRLNVFPIEVPPLRERKEDISRLVRHFVEKLNRTHQKNLTGVHSAVFDSLKKYPWPGNVRELENLTERAYIVEKSPVLTLSGYPLEMVEPARLPNEFGTLALETSLPLAEARHHVLETFERQYIQAVLKRSQGRISEAARLAGVGPRQLNKLMNRYGIRRADFIPCIAKASL